MDGGGGKERYFFTAVYLMESHGNLKQTRSQWSAKRTVDRHGVPWISCRIHNSVPMEMYLGRTRDHSLVLYTMSSEGIENILDPDDNLKSTKQAVICMILNIPT